MAITIIQKETIIELYSAYFNRAADASGITFWEKSFEIYFRNTSQSLATSAREKITLSFIASDISNSTEYKGLYPATLNNSLYIDKIYKNLLGRDADSGGKEFWINHLNKGTMNLNEAIIHIIEGAKSNTSTQGKLDASFIQNKTAVSIYVVESLKLEDVSAVSSLWNNITSNTASVVTAKTLLDSMLKKSPTSETPTL
ncbi:MAG: DUF4214 domain-containing protein, partial [Methylococcales bacterium]|nr:DUF4214 domain-containing protein [Methylococcales bacterium]